jgi:hypothetical protein
MDLQHLSQLKQRLLEGDDYADVLMDFLEVFGNDPSFMELGEPVQNDLLMSIICEGAREVLPEPIRLDWVMLIKIAEAHFIHGSFLLCGRVANVIYFPDAGVGVFAVILSMGNDPGTRVFKFSTVVLTDPSRN